MRWHYVTGAVFGRDHPHVRVQRAAVDGTVRVDERARPARSPRDVFTGGPAAAGQHFLPSTATAWNRLCWKGGSSKEVESGADPGSPVLRRPLDGAGGARGQARTPAPAGTTSPVAPKTSERLIVPPTRWRCARRRSATSRCVARLQASAARRPGDRVAAALTTTTRITTHGIARHRCRCCASSSTTRPRRGSTSIRR